MAYRRRQGLTRAATFKEEICHPPDDSSSSSLAAQAIRASSAHRDSSFSSAYGESALASANRERNRQKSSESKQDPTSYEYTSMKSLNESKHGFWGVLARKAKAILEDDNVAQKFETSSITRPQSLETSSGDQFHQPYRSPESSPKIQKGLDAITSSLNYLGGTIGKSLEEGLTLVENRTADIIQETRRLHIRKKGSSSDSQNQPNDVCGPQQQAQTQTVHETQVKASRDIRLQLETLLAEKARLAHENSVYARENRFLREIVEYHQLTMQDIVYLDEGIEEVTEVNPISFPTTPTVDSAPMLTPTASTPPSPPLRLPPHDFAATVNPVVDKDVLRVPSPSVTEVVCSAVPPGSSVHVSAMEDPVQSSKPCV
ncbi:hypothetical protein NE237_010781 [Protea cynaroides]|uniref:Uncharacterized protein n=1 Tax=Protea cynaroides TaxID=273540 RepID=A0A9Q0L196_9MAGN|nr:hypothetical protein NE237_010781 [Protea cynaroides]